MRLVTDASVGVKWVAVESDSGTANSLLGAGHELHAPTLLASEVGNALWRKVRAGHLTPDEATQAASRIANMTLVWANDTDLTVAALGIALTLNRAIYDCVYLALAYRVDAILVTADERFYNAVSATEHSGRVMLLSAFAPQ